MGVATAPLEIAGSNGDELRKLGFESLNGGCLTHSQTGDVATAPLGKSRGQRETN